MDKPPKLSKEQLQHPKDQRSKFNGDKRREASKQGFMCAGRISVVEGTREPENLKRNVNAHLTPEGRVEGQRDFSGAIKPIPEGHSFGPCIVSQEVDLHGHTENQKRMLSRRGRSI